MQGHFKMQIKNIVVIAMIATCTVKPGFAAVMTSYTVSGSGGTCATDSGGDYIVVECECVNKYNNAILGGKKVQDCPDNNGVTFSGTCAYNNNVYSIPVNTDECSIDKIHGHFCATPADAADPCKLCGCITASNPTVYDYKDNPYETSKSFSFTNNIDTGFGYCKQNISDLKHVCVDGYSYYDLEKGKCLGCPSGAGSVRANYRAADITDCYLESNSTNGDETGWFIYTEECYYTK